MEAPASGILRRVTAKPDDEIKVLSPIAIIVAPGEEVGVEETLEPVETPAEPELAAVPQVPEAPTHERLFVSPRARRLAEQEGISLTGLQGTGPDGAIVERDVRTWLERRAAATQAPALPAITPVARRIAENVGLDWRNLSGSGPGGRITRADVERTLAAPPVGTGFVPPATPPTGLEGDVSEIIPMRSVRAVIAERMAQSHSETAPVTLTAEADATALVELRQRLTAQGLDVSYNDLLLYILARALREHPRLNASLDGETIKVWKRVDIGLAVDTDRGLLVPVVRDVDRKGLAQLSEETKKLGERVRQGKLTPDELRGGTFTLTNLGMFGIDGFTPIINLPECAILGVGRIKQKPVWIAPSSGPGDVGGHVEGRFLVWLSLTFDHRLVDGGPAARFLQTVVGYVEQPHLLLA